MSSANGAMRSLKAVFDKYAGKDGDEDTLTKSELAEMLREELLEAGVEDKSGVADFFHMLDDDGDGVVDFKEFATFIATFTLLCAMC